jgi:cytochrome c
MKRFLLLSLTVFFVLIIVALTAFHLKKKEVRLLVFSRTQGYRHQSIGTAKRALTKLGKENGFAVDTTENAEFFTENTLKKYNAVIFLHTTGNVLNAVQEREFERYIQAGGNYVGIHAAADCEYDWKWYGRLAGGYFKSHPAIQEAIVRIRNKNNPATRRLPDAWKRTDEWYNFKDINPDVTVLATLDESSYKGGENGENHPVAWVHEFDGGRAFYTAFGHTDESWTEPEFLQHLLGGIRYAVGKSKETDYSKAHSMRMPDENRFEKTLLAGDLDEPMELSVAPDGRVFFVERKGKVKLFDPKTNQTAEIAELPVSLKYNNGNNAEDGVLGIALDPDFSANNHIFIFYSPAGTIPKQHISRFTFQNGKLDLTSEKVVLVIPNQRDECCHSGGSLLFDENGNLFISAGDNSNPFGTAYAPVDMRENRSPWDAQKSSANPNDLRGKVLRIHPEPDGSYTVPEGNLFARDGKGGKPEIYIMGCRNPYRIAFDNKRKFLYWGDVGPDAGKDSTRGPRGYDEINQARKPGFFGWPYFIADNKPYELVDFNTQAYLGKNDPAHPVNRSPNNTGVQNLPPAQKAFIFYPYAASPEFPEVGSGGRTAMAGPTFYKQDFPVGSPTKFPDYYDGKLFIYEWMRGWMMAVSLKPNGDYESMEPFLPATRLSNPTDMQFGADGSLYMLEYGSTWFGKDANARLIRIRYEAGNRSPKVQAKALETAGKQPFTVHFQSKALDPDGDAMTYAWQFDGQKTQSAEANPVFTFTRPGIFHPTLTVTDKPGKSSTVEMEVKVGNSPPQISLESLQNTGFYFDQPLTYQVKITDADEVQPDLSKARLSLYFLTEGFDKVEAEAAHTAEPLGHHTGENAEVQDLTDAAFAGQDCLACHKVVGNSVGPAMVQVALKYKSDPKAPAYLAKKIVNGGSGVWGDREMAAHPQLTQPQVSAMVKYILSLSEPKTDLKNLPLSGKLSLNQHQGKSEKGRYFLKASYTDAGTPETGSLTATQTWVLRNPKVQAEDFDQKSGGTVYVKDFGSVIGSLAEGNYLVFRQIDLNEIKEIVFRISSEKNYGTVEIRADSVKGKLLAHADFSPTGDWNKPADLTAPVDPTAGQHDIFVIFVRNNRTSSGGIDCNLDWLDFRSSQPPAKRP